MSKIIYCVYITTYSGSKMPPLYIGSSSVEKVKNGYYGSVSSKKWKHIWKTELRENPDYFKSMILMCYDTREEALRFELELHKELDVVKNVNFINESFAQVNGFFGRDVSGDKNPMFGLSKENSELIRKTSAKISISRKKFCDENPDKHPNLGKPGWNAGLSKEDNESIAIQAHKIQEFYKTEEGKNSLAQGLLTKKLKDEQDPSRVERRNQKYKETGEKRLKLTEEERQQVISWFLQGHTRTNIVKMLHNKVSISPICKIIKNYLKTIQGEI